MNDYIILTDSSCDLPQKMVEKLKISVLPLTLLIDGKTYTNYLDESDINFPKFYDLLRSGQSAKTSAVNVDVFETAMKKILDQGKDILYIGFSSGLSCTSNNGIIAAQKLSEEYPSRKIYVIDSLCGSLGQGLLIYLAAKEKEKGKSIDEVKSFVEQTKLNICHWFTVEDLHHLKRGGRVSATVAIIGSMLNIKPIMHVDDDGKLVNVSKVRGRKASIEELANRVEKNSFDNIGERSVFISHGDCENDAKYLASLLKKKLKVKDIVINFVGPVIGAHSGPGTLAVFFAGPVR